MSVPRPSEEELELQSKIRHLRDVISNSPAERDRLMRELDMLRYDCGRESLSRMKRLRGLDQLKEEIESKIQRARGKPRDLYASELKVLTEQLTTVTNSLTELQLQTPSEMEFESKIQVAKGKLLDLDARPSQLQALVEQLSTARASHVHRTWIENRVRTLSELLSTLNAQQSETAPDVESKRIQQIKMAEKELALMNELSILDTSNQSNSVFRHAPDSKKIHVREMEQLIRNMNKEQKVMKRVEALSKKKLRMMAVALKTNEPELAGRPM